MKNKNLLKILGISLLAVVLLTWIIPSSNIDSTSVLKTGAVAPAGLLSIFGSFDIVASYFLQNSILILLIGGFYGLVNKTGAYKTLIDGIKAKFKNKEKYLLIFSIAFFMIIPAVTNIYFPLFIFVPFFVSILLSFDFNKKTIILSTVASVLIGMSANISSTLFAQITKSTTNTYLWVKVAFLVVALAVTVIYAIKMSTSKKGSKKQIEELDESVIFIPQKSESKSKVKSTWLIVVMSLMFVLVILGLTPWNFDLFKDMNTSIMAFTIGNFAIFKNFFGAFNAFGVWSYTELYTLILLATLFVGIIYRVKVKDMFESFCEGTKKLFGVAVLVALVNLIIITSLNSGIIATVLKTIASTGNAALVTLAAIIGSPFVVDQLYVANYNTVMLQYAIGKAADVNFIALITQLTYGIIMLVVPTSVALIAGLAYVGEDYSKWFKYIWKLAALLMILVFIAIAVASLIK